MKTLNFQKKSLAEIFVSRPPRKNATGEVHQEIIRTLNPNKKEYSEKDVKSGRNIRGGLANNGNMLRVDVFSKKNAKGKEEFYLVPVYLADRANDCLPNKAIVSQKPEEEWTVMDETYLFKFSLYKDDLMAVIKKGKDSFFILFFFIVFISIFFMEVKMTAIFIVFVSVFLFQSHLVLSAEEKNDCPIVSDVAEKSAKNASVVVEVPFPAEDDGKIKGLKEFHRTDYPTMSLMPDEKENAEQKSLYRPEFK